MHMVLYPLLYYIIVYSIITVTRELQETTLSISRTLDKESLFLYCFYLFFTLIKSRY